MPDFGTVDVMMTHGPPMGILDETNTREHVGCEHLLRAARRCKPQLHCFGHIHEGWGAQKVKWRESDDLDVRWEEHIERSEDVQVSSSEMAEVRAAKIDLSAASGSPIEYGKETLMVNASIMTLAYKPWNGPWQVDLDLEKAN